MKVRGDDTLEGAHSLSRFLRQISSFSGDFLKTLTEMGSIHWVGVQTWLWSSHEGKRWWHPRGGSFVVTLLEAISSFSRYFLKTLTAMASIHWGGVQTWLQSSHAEKRWWHPRGGSFICGSIGGKSPPFWSTFFKKFPDPSAFLQSVLVWNVYKNLTISTSFKRGRFHNIRDLCLLTPYSF